MVARGVAAGLDHWRTVTQRWRRNKFELQLIPSAIRNRTQRASFQIEIKDVDMVIDIGNSRTTALLIEDNSNFFNQVRQLH